MRLIAWFSYCMKLLFLLLHNISRIHHRNSHLTLPWLRAYTHRDSQLTLAMIPGLYSFYTCCDSQSHSVYTRRDSQSILSLHMSWFPVYTQHTHTMIPSLYSVYTSRDSHSTLGLHPPCRLVYTRSTPPVTQSTQLRVGWHCQPDTHLAYIHFDSRHPPTLTPGPHQPSFPAHTRCHSQLRWPSLQTYICRYSWFIPALTFDVHKYNAVHIRLCYHCLHY